MDFFRNHRGGDAPLIDSMYRALHAEGHIKLYEDHIEIGTDRTKIPLKDVLVIELQLGKRSASVGFVINGEKYVANLPTYAGTSISVAGIYAPDLLTALGYERKERIHNPLTMQTTMVFRRPA